MLSILGGSVGREMRVRREIHVQKDLFHWIALQQQTTDAAIYSGYSAGHDLIAHSLAIVQFTLCREGKSVRLLDQSDLGFFPQLRRESNDEGARFPQ